LVCTTTDASFGNEFEEVSEVNEAGRRQQGHVNCLAPADVVNSAVVTIHPISWSSTVRRVCRATLQAETISLTKGVEAGTRLRAAIVDMKSKLNIKNWEEDASSQMGHVWMTDCDSLYEHLISPKQEIGNGSHGSSTTGLGKKWRENAVRRPLVGRLPAMIDTSTMIADPLTKAMNGERLVQALATG
jgi:hypothetical protein